MKASLPAYIETAPGLFVGIHEANLTDWIAASKTEQRGECKRLARRLIKIATSETINPATPLLPQLA